VAADGFFGVCFEGCEEAGWGLGFI
jgi:hypothetical protein